MWKDRRYVSQLFTGVIALYWLFLLILFLSKTFDVKINRVESDKGLNYAMWNSSKEREQRLLFVMNAANEK